MAPQAITLIQTTCHAASSDELRSELSSLGQLLRENGSHDLVVFPELWPVPYLSGSAFFENARPISVWLESGLRDLAADLGATLVVGVPERAGSEIFNSTVTVSPDGDETRVYRKIHLVPGREAPYFTRGQNRTLQDFGGVSLGMAICYDAGYFPELIRAYADDGMGCLVVPAAWGADYAPNATSESITAAKELSRTRLLSSMVSRAIENGIWIILANRCGKEIDDHGHLDFVGHGTIIAPDGRSICQLGYEEGFCTSRIDLRARPSVGSLSPRENRVPDSYV